MNREYRNNGNSGVTNLQRKVSNGAAANRGAQNQSNRAPVNGKFGRKPNENIAMNEFQEEYSKPSSYFSDYTAGMKQPG